MSFDILAIANLLRDAAQTEVMPRFRRLSKDDIRTKTEPTDLVTEGDEAAERFIRREIAALLPNAQFIGEESVAADLALLDTLSDADLAVVVDPIDGTSNFVAGVPLFGVMAAIARKGETVAGILYDPFADDFVLAEKGGGAFTVGADGNRQPISGSRSRATGAHGWARLTRPDADPTKGAGSREPRQGAHICLLSLFGP